MSTCRICGPTCQDETTVTEVLPMDATKRERLEAKGWAVGDAAGLLGADPTSTERPQICPRTEESITGSPESFAGHNQAQRADYARHRLGEAMAAYLLRYGLADEWAAKMEFAERCEGMCQRLRGEWEAEKRARRGR